MTLHWIKSLGFTFRSSASLELYRDGHERADVVIAREKFVNTILNDIFPYMTKYTVTLQLLLKELPITQQQAAHKNMIVT